ncbi:allene oxide cyclase barrel-like domain-containing protein [Streptomyces sp. NPDC001156]
MTARQAQSQSLDLGTKGLSPGDELVIAEDLYSGGRKIGDHSVVCIYIRVQPGDVQLECVGTFALPEGQITSQALLHLKGQATSAPAVDIALTGGSGAYSTARRYAHRRGRWNGAAGHLPHHPGRSLGGIGPASTGGRTRPPARGLFPGSRRRSGSRPRRQGCPRPRLSPVLRRLAL